VACSGQYLRSAAVAACIAVGALFGVGCNPADKTATPGSTAAQPAPAASAPSFKGQRLYTGPHRTPKGMRGLTISGYNYTDTYIDSFAVNGAGGGNLEVSQPSSGGGGACCAAILDDFPLPMTVEVSWKRDGDAPWCKQTVLLDGPLPKEPNYLEVHFYQDGTIQLAITDYPSPARVKLQRFNRLQRHASGNVDNDIKFSECKSGR
jgi:Protein of unknown function (DUF3304)